MFHRSQTCATLMKPEKLKEGDVRILQDTEIGDIKTCFSVYGETSEGTLANGFYVEEMK